MSSKLDDEREWLSHDIPDGYLAWIRYQSGTHYENNTDLVVEVACDFWNSDRRKRLLAIGIERKHMVEWKLNINEDSFDKIEKQAEFGEPSHFDPNILCTHFRFPSSSEVLSETIRIHNLRKDMPWICDMIRNALGNPFRSVDFVSKNTPDYLADKEVISLAELAYNQRTENGFLDKEILLVLSDALEEAGCQEEKILKHLRNKKRCPECLGRGYHHFYDKIEPNCSTCNRSGWLDIQTEFIRGDFALDLILGKE